VLKHTKEIFIPVFSYALPYFEVLFTFNNSSNDIIFAIAALLESRIFLH
jgi:hypothetical protein